MAVMYVDTQAESEIRENAVLASLPQDEREHILRSAEVVNVQRGDTLAESGKPVRYVWFPRTAVAAAVVDEPDGSAIEVALIGHEGVVGISLFFGSEVSATTAVVQVPGTMVRLPALAVRTEIIAARGALYATVLAYVDAFVATLTQTAACNSLHGVDQRLARWILMTHDRVEDEMPLTQEFLAGMLGVRRATVSISASNLQLRGLIKYRRGKLQISDRDALERQACSCYAADRRIMRASARP